ncbi:MAG: hypothetical protein H7Y88_03580 [Phycisphaerales bacterium]|nr:hypothetical protein [Phycisphaerales bacterium]
MSSHAVLILFRTLAALAIALAPMTQAVGAPQPAPAAPNANPVLSQLAALDSPVLSERDRAMQQLAGHADATLPALEQVLHDPSISAEQRARMSRVALSRFAISPRAAMGFSFGGVLPNRVSVAATFANFDSHKKLRTGDMMVEADGHSLVGPTAQRLLRAIIQSHDPGDMIHLVVRRGAERLKIDVRLGRYDQLPRQNGLSPEGISDEIVRAWRVRCARLAPAKAAIVDPGVTADQWRGVERSVQMIRAGVARQRSSHPSAWRQTVFAGGEPRQAPSDLDEQGKWIMARGKDEVNMRQAQGVFIADPLDAGPGMPRTRTNEIQQVRNAIASYRQLAARRLQEGPGPGEMVRMGPISNRTYDEAIILAEMELAALIAEAQENGEPIDLPAPGPQSDSDR